MVFRSFSFARFFFHLSYSVKFFICSLNVCRLEGVYVKNLAEIEMKANKKSQTFQSNIVNILIWVSSFDVNGRKEILCSTCDIFLLHLHIWGILNGDLY